MRGVALLCVLATVSATNHSDLYDVSKGPLVTHLVWFDMKIGTVYAGRIVFGLFGRTVPIAVRNFVDLAKPRPYNSHKGGFMINVSKGNEMGGGNPDCDSDYGEDYRKENFKLQHYGAGWVGAVGAGEGRSNSCLFYICLKPMHHVDGKNVVFAKIVKGMNVIRKIEEVPVKNNGPTTKVAIANCGTKLADPPFRVARIAAVD